MDGIFRPRSFPFFFLFFLYHLLQSLRFFRLYYSISSPHRLVLFRAASPDRIYPPHVISPVLRTSSTLSRPVRFLLQGVFKSRFSSLSLFLFFVVFILSSPSCPGLRCCCFSHRQRSRSSCSRLGVSLSRRPEAWQPRLSRETPRDSSRRSSTRPLISRPTSSDQTIDAFLSCSCFSCCVATF